MVWNNLRKKGPCYHLILKLKGATSDIVSSLEVKNQMGL